MTNPLIALLLGLLTLFILSLLFWPKGGLVGYIQKSERLSNQVLQEDALKQLHKAERHGKDSSIESIAGALSISQSHAAHLLTDLQTNDFVKLEGENFLLSDTGREYALKIIRAHRLLERYLAEETGYHQSKWHDMAERREHKLSIEETNALSVQLGYPTHDPHGDPIPTAALDFVLHGGEPLTNMSVDQPLQIVHIEDEPQEIYTQLIAEGIYPGMQIRILEKNNRRINFLGNNEEHILAPIFAANISVTPISKEDIREECLGEPLNTLKPGEYGSVVNISPQMRGVERRRMMDLGILPGTIIKAEMKSPGGDPTAYKIRDALIALRDEQSELICIKKTMEAN